MVPTLKAAFASPRPTLIEAVVDPEEKPSKPKSHHAVIGIYMYDGTVFDKVKTLVPSGRGELEITDVNNAYIREGTMSFSHLPGWWTDAGTFESLWHASNMVREKVLRASEEKTEVRGA